ncbi:MAG: ATP-binding protein [Acidobacteria bacterium]|nr:ATP-binding protein [Acidobacteriota bacterium]
MANRGSEQQDGATKRVDATYESQLGSVDTAEMEVLEIAQQAGFLEEELHKISIALREAMVNAVVHGNKYSAQKKVRLKAWTDVQGLHIVVADEGNGFDLSGVPDPLADANLLRESGRGILLIQAFVDEFQVRRLYPAGTEVTLVKYRAQG